MPAYLPDWVLELYRKKWLSEMERQGVRIEESSSKENDLEAVKKLIEEIERKEKSCGRD